MERKKTDNDSGGSDGIEYEGRDGVIPPGKVDSIDDFVYGTGNDSIVEIDHGFASDLDKWITLNNTENLTPEIFLYKLPPQGNKPRSLISKFDSFIPDDHHIGMTFGSGRYCLIVHIPKGNQQRQRCSMRAITIDPYYDKLRREEEAKKAISFSPSQVHGNFTPPAAVVDPMIIMERFMGMILPLLTKQQADPGVSMIQTYAALNRIMAGQAAENAGLMSDMQRKILALPASSEDTEEPETLPEPETGIMDKIISLFNSPAVSAVIQSLTKSNPQAQLAGQAVKAIPEVKRILVDPAQLKATVNYLDGKLGIKNTEAVLRNLKVRRPEGTGMKVAPLIPRPKPIPPIYRGKKKNQMVNGAMDLGKGSPSAVRSTKEKSA